jgi:hypothetical protein
LISRATQPEKPSTDAWVKLRALKGSSFTTSRRKELKGERDSKRQVLSSSTVAAMMEKVDDIKVNQLDTHG